jgi:hypothetical protein
MLKIETTPFWQRLGLLSALWKPREKALGRGKSAGEVWGNLGVVLALESDSEAMRAVWMLWVKREAVGAEDKVLGGAERFGTCWERRIGGLVVP